MRSAYLVGVSVQYYDYASEVVHAATLRYGRILNWHFAVLGIICLPPEASKGNHAISAKTGYY